MTEQGILPSVPAVRLELVEDLTPQQPDGFLRLVRRRFVAIGPDGERSSSFIYDEVDRRAIDAVVVVAYYLDAAGRARVFLRSATRPPVAMRAACRQPIPGGTERPGLWEVVAGLVEERESSPAGIVECAKRELAEELGFDVSLTQLRELGHSVLPAPGVIGERHYFFVVEVDPARRQRPSLDGSALEQLGVVIDTSLADALSACSIGEIEDAKTELGLRRLAELLEQSA
jgi:ADP-ribose pyrophosphatase